MGSVIYLSIYQSNKHGHQVIYLSIEQTWVQLSFLDLETQTQHSFPLPQLVTVILKTILQQMEERVMKGKEIW